MDRSPVLKRPKPTDGEEELFRMQEEFLKNKQQPSAKVIKLKESAKSLNVAYSNSQTSSNRVKSKFSELKKLKSQERVFTSQTSGDVINPAIKEVEKNLNFGIKDSVQNINIAPSKIILGNIIEKKYDAHNYEFHKKKFICSNTGFPEVFVSKHMKNDKNESLFMQKISIDSNSKIEKSLSFGPLCNTDNSVIIEGPWANEIHKENLERLSQMSQEDILKEKSKLEMTLKPELIQFLKDRRNKKQNTNKSLEDKRLNTEKQDQNVKSTNLITEDVPNKCDEDSLKNNDVSPMQIDTIETDIPKPPKELMEQAKEKGWMHMDSLEVEKLKWMENIPPEKKDEPAPNEPYNARFDFNGVLLPYKDDNVPIEKGLHHHGEEPDRPGYSLQELLQLSRSSAQQQRCTALTTLANILEKSRNGWYDKVLQPAPLVALSQKNFLLLLRFSLDDTSAAVITATLQALRIFLYSEADEVCLDRLYGFQNYKEPILATPKTDVDDINDLKDHELAQLDAVAALLRTDILLRISYILSEIRPPPVAVTCALEILIRLVRHSPITVVKITNTPNLLETIIEHFMPLSTDALAMTDTINNVYGVPVVAAIRFYRILLCYGGKPVAQKLNNLKIMQRIISYGSCDAGKSSYNLIIENLRLWRTLLLYENAVDSLTGAQLFLVSQLQLLLSNHDIQNASELSCEYAAALIAVASCLTPLKANISILLSKWSTQLLSLNNVTWSKTKLIAETLLAVSDNAIKTLNISRSQVFSNLNSTSNLLSDCSLALEREPSALPHLGVLTYDGQLQPIVSQQSCMPFLATILNVFIDHFFIEEIQTVLNLPQVYKYLKRLVTTDWCLEKSWYTRSELSFLVAIVNASSLVKDKLDNKTMHIIWKIATKLVSSLPADCPSDVKKMLRISLAEEKLNLEIVTSKLETLNLNSNIEDIKLNLSRNVSNLYERYVALNGKWDQAAMPKDWLYLPVVHIYTKCRNNNVCNDDDKAAILAVLSLELVLPDLVEKLSQNLRFSRLVLIYLCETLYLSNDVSALLTKAMTTLLKDNYKKLNFTIDLPGLNSFTDLFTAMCEHFCSTSYGDYGFSMTLLVPIAQRHNVHYRKLLWSEHVGLLRYVRLPLEQLVIPLKEYLYPLEEDISLIESYITVLIRGIIKQSWCPIPYTIALHHSGMYLKRSNKLAIRMRTQLEKIFDKVLASLLLNYQPPTF
ncbi:hypothetical protein QLX08_009046 [Tetragonisca angustula]|uniref:RNA polymerase II-associated protein 1 n=1 Tax=Tetragonisca angustula TaxID=166442 RepID=A0AAW0ZIG7_9HYME